MTVKVSTKIKDGNLAEIYQSMQAKQALCVPAKGKDNFERITPFVLCRDFLTDVYSFSKAKMDFNIYGMSFNGSTEKPHWDSVLVVMRFPNEAALTAFKAHLPLLNKIEEGNKFTPTTMEKVEETKFDFLIVGDKEWLQSCLSFSLYTLLLRVLCYTFDGKGDWLQTFAKGKSSDANYIRSVAPSVWAKILGDLSLLKMKEWCGFEIKKDAVPSIHHNSGFVSVFGTHTEINRETVKKNAHWQHMKKLGLELATK